MVEQIGLVSVCVDPIRPTITTACLYTTYTGLVLFVNLVGLDHYQV